MKIAWAILGQRLATQGALHGVLGLGGAAFEAGQGRALGQLGLAQGVVVFRQARKGLQCRLGGLHLAGEPIAAGLGLCGQCGQPQVQGTVLLGIAKHADGRGQREHIGLPLAQIGVGGAASNALQQAALVVYAGGVGWGQAHGLGTAAALDGRTVEVRAPMDPSARVGFMAAIEELPLTGSKPAAKVVINPRTGSIVMNQAVSLKPSAIAHGNLAITINSTPVISQPGPFSQGGQTVVAEKAKEFYDAQRKQIAENTPEGVDPNFRQFVDSMPDQFKTFMDDATKAFHDLSERGRSTMSDFQDQVQSAWKQWEDQQREQRAAADEKTGAFDLRDAAEATSDAASAVAPEEPVIPAPAADAAAEEYPGEGKGDVRND